jgi:hypothetical protein
VYDFDLNWFDDFQGRVILDSKFFFKKCGNRLALQKYVRNQLTYYISCCHNYFF